MATQAELFVEARKRMVDSQIRPNRVTDPRILMAMRTLPRERFLPASARALAYTDEDVPLGNGRFMMEPMVLARMLQAAALREGEQVLVVGAATGYGAAVLEACGCRVTALEEDHNLLAIAGSVLATEAPNVTLVSGALRDGWPSRAPYDLILIEGAVPEVPPALSRQVHQGNGRIITAIHRHDAVTQAVQAEQTGGGLGFCTLFDCATPPLPSLREAPRFAF